MTIQQGALHADIRHGSVRVRVLSQKVIMSSTEREAEFGAAADVGTPDAVAGVDGAEEAVEIDQRRVWLAGGRQDEGAVVGDMDSGRSWGHGDLGNVLQRRCAAEADADPDRLAAILARRLGALAVDAALLMSALVFWYIVIAYAAWWLIVLSRGQTPGKQVLGLVAVTPDGERLRWGQMFVREIFKLMTWGFTLGLGIVIDITLLVLSDESRTVADRVRNSTIVHVSTLQS
ncbi:RDD family protein [Candidatus Poriferisodalis sp.]|uniref:RDD family protein n=1 Tax=Candidatus Poriferisodalis sp. TaxID=3101277 RepID=UPI003B018E8A